ncbi:PREDICTED: PITH domain-containing protein CG6153 [Wasmannia auropunctata]|uniref:PITH domain-containing protein CG6153 n=1 Tax=Wasmannia auropunctata TaxID=64793 RepID=UPI0005EF1889|nr:PREDICTED: PITH domain-containing protein CG6153 [Wasmannia auropunctata]XP_011690669.1 PREDICTED: PITH domain-containing protein CG6153 [Wasmannia auropunctata]XP_011690670.1 PREDICTED: PITH domain-containing protein CG6153 [Wasmannia auropunctata]
MEHQCNHCNGHHTAELGASYSLFEKIDKDRVECLNELEEGSGIKVFKTWEDRLDRSQYVESDVDDELLFNIPFTGDVKLKGLIVIADEESFPKTVKLYKNRPHMLFEHVGAVPEQEFELTTDSCGIHEYPIRTVKFSSMQHLSLYFTGNGNSDEIKIYYIGLKGEWTPAHKHGVTICTYEARPLISDHPTDFNDVSRIIK